MKNIAIVTLGLMMSFPIAYAKDEESPGGQTIGGGMNAKVQASEGFGATIFQCIDCGVPACLTVRKMNDGNLRIQIVNGAGEDRDLLFGTRKSTRTHCYAQLELARALCEAGRGDCDFQYRVDQMGPFAAMDDPNDPNGN